MKIILENIVTDNNKWFDLEYLDWVIKDSSISLLANLERNTNTVIALRNLIKPTTILNASKSPIHETVQRLSMFHKVRTSLIKEAENNWID